jgi:uncharacterized protein (DUF362 family)
MSKNLVAIVRYEKPLESVRRAVELCRGLDHLPSRARAFIKPNIVFWTMAVPFPKWGVITTSRVVEDLIILLKERGIDDITVGEGTVTMNPKDLATPAHAFETLGYGKLKQKYGIKYMNTDALDSDFVVDLPVMKAHNQTVVSLGIKNLKGLIDVPSRKKCHNMTPGKDLHFWVSKLADKMPPMLTLQDGIYTNERGPAPDGKLQRSNLLVASADVLSADLVGAAILGYKPEQVPHLMRAAENHGRPWDFSDIEVVGERIDAVARHLKYDFEYSETEEVILPAPLVKQGLKGVFYQKYDLSMCTYCSGLNGLMMSAIRFAWKGKAWDNVEILTGKSMSPTPGKKKTIMLGKCIYQAHKDNPDIQEAIPIKGCPPKPEDMLKALHQAGIEADPGLFENVEALPGFFMGRYEGKPEFDEGFFKVK